MRELLRLHDEGQVMPEPVADLGPLPSCASRAAHALRAEFELRFGLRLADGTDEPLMMAVSEVIASGIVSTRGGASKLLKRLVQWGVIWSPGEMPKLGNANGTKLFLPGRRPVGPEPEHGWRVRPDYEARALLDDAPGPVLEPGAVPVEAEDVSPGTVEPAMELEHEPGVGDAVPGAPSGPLDGVTAAVGSADGRTVDAVTVGHEATGYAPPSTATLTSRLPLEVLIDWAVERAVPGKRNAVGFELAQQMRDNGRSIHSAEMVLDVFRDRVPPGDHEYTRAEAMRSVRSAYSRPPREPWVGLWHDPCAGLFAEFKADTDVE